MENRVTKAGIEAKIVDKQYLVLPDGRSTLCILTLQNGFTIKGFSACVDIDNFDIVMGRDIAYEDAFRQIWALEGYLRAAENFLGSGFRDDGAQIFESAVTFRRWA